MPIPWRRREQRDGRRDRNSNTENRRSQVKARNNGRREDRKCHGCGKTGHLVVQCPRTRCFECGTEGHVARQCPYMYRRREQNVPEPMEVNAQRLRRRVISRRTNRSRSESTEMSETSGTETEAGDYEREYSQKGKRRTWRRKGEAARTRGEF
ncbi:CCHC-type zinc finger nucleic acid binding protein-like [Halyomorpha halys]|uniref:CCHC-type zinc finger nucleic acid binding protein-like n=1 Tax=Halyomorpha halys TaxID=286706 RepID=UPI0034D1C9D3